MQFIETDVGYIPVDRVVRIERSKSGTCDHIEYHDGERVRKTKGHYWNIVDMGDRDVPASPGYYVLSVPKGVVVTGEVLKTPVVAWRMLPEGTLALPVTVAGSESLESDVILTPDGQVLEPGVGQWESLEAYRENVKKRKPESENKSPSH